MFWSKLFIGLKTYWYIPAILILIIVLSIFLRKGNPALDILNNAIESYKKQIAELERLNQEKEKAKAELEAKYLLVVHEIESHYQSDNVKLDEEKRKRIKELLEQYKDEPELLAIAFSQEFGLKLEK